MKTDVVKEGFFEAYDHIRDAVFVKDNKSGDIIFANKAMDKLFGYSLVGMRAKEVVNDQLEQNRKYLYIMCSFYLFLFFFRINKLQSAPVSVSI